MNVIVHPSPVGPLTLVSDGENLVGCYFANHDLAHREWSRHGKAPHASDAVLDRAARELDRFFAGRLTEFTVPVAPKGTPFQSMVWKALRRIPYGKTTTYGAIAARVGRPAATRAVGAANGNNPICIIIPCHRVIGANGALTGFGGGLERKKFLLGLALRGATSRSASTELSEAQSAT